MVKHNPSKTFVYGFALLQKTSESDSGYERMKLSPNYSGYGNIPDVDDNHNEVIRDYGSTYAPVQPVGVHSITVDIFAIWYFCCRIVLLVSTDGDFVQEE